MLEEAEEEARRVRTYLESSPSQPVRSRLLVTTEAQVCLCVGMCGYGCVCGGWGVAGVSRALIAEHVLFSTDPSPWTQEVNGHRGRALIDSPATVAGPGGAGGAGGAREASVSDRACLIGITWRRNPNP